jgi:hypothetical protein
MYLFLVLFLFKYYWKRFENLENHWYTILSVILIFSASPVFCRILNFLIKKKKQKISGMLAKCRDIHIQHINILLPSWIKLLGFSSGPVWGHHLQTWTWTISTVIIFIRPEPGPRLKQWTSSMRFCLCLDQSRTIKLSIIIICFSWLQNHSDPHPCTSWTESLIQCFFCAACWAASSAFQHLHSFLQLYFSFMVWMSLKFSGRSQDHCFVSVSPVSEKAPSQGTDQPWIGK